MKHLGDITKITGYDVPAVSVVIGGSPCQDLSVAGKRAGFDGERSVLFLDQIRVIKEMREEDERNGRTGVDVRPRFMVWENVPGAFSSKSGEDFRCVLEETARVKAPDAVIPGLAKWQNGTLARWRNAGVILGDGWSIAWRVLDAQFWGVPQRRRRIALVADFGGHTAPEILFERGGMSGDSETGGTAGEGTAGDAENGVGTAVDGNKVISFQGEAGAEASLCIGVDVGASLCASKELMICLNDQGGSVMGVSEDVTGTLRAQEHGHQPVVYNEETITSKANASNPHEGDPCHTLGATGAGRAICIQGNVVDRDANCNGKGWRDDDVSFTLNTIDRPAVYAMQGFGDYKETGVASPCKQRDHKDATDLICAVDCRNGVESPDINGTLQAKSNGGMSLNLQNVVRTNQTVRRLTPLECERLQGYPDGWTDIGEWVDSKGKKHISSDSARYKALGNSIALPPWRYVLGKLIRYCEEKTMASLFDGIGGFPLIWGELGGETLWASEIEEFPIAVTKRRFGAE